MFSILVHEEPDVILDQLENIFHFNNESMVVIHFNPTFNQGVSTLSFERLLLILEQYKNKVFVNPERLEVGFANIIQAHLSNYKYVKNVDFDYFYFISSNELFLKSGVSDFVGFYDYGCEKRKNPKWHYINELNRDDSLKKILSCINSNTYVYSQIEGTFYSKRIFDRICSIIEGNYNYKTDQKVIYPREEVYFSTIAACLFKNDNCYENCLCKIRWQGKILFTSIRSVKKVLDKSSNYYSVKRVDRRFNNYLRSYIRDYLTNYGDRLPKYSLNIKKRSLLLIYFLNLYYLLIYFIRDKIAKIYRFLIKK